MLDKLVQLLERGTQLKVFNVERPQHEYNAIVLNIEEIPTAYYDDIDNATNYRIYLNLVTQNNIGELKDRIRKILRDNGYIIQRISPAFKGQDVPFYQQQFTILVQEDY